MGFQIIFRQDKEDFPREVLLGIFMKMDGISNVNDPGVSDSVISADFRYKNSSIVIELRDDGHVACFSGDIAFVEFGLRLQKLTDCEIRLTDDSYSYDLSLGRYNSIEEIEDKICMPDPYDDYP